MGDRVSAALKAARNNLETLQFLYENSSHRMGPSYRAQVAEAQAEVARLEQPEGAAC